jgi:hypothetical protein
MIDKISAKVAYAVVSFGGFLGMGEEGRPNPSRRRYRSLDSDEGLCATSQKQRTRSRPLGDSR